MITTNSIRSELLTQCRTHPIYAMALLVVAIINIHHFIVDRYIWRLRRPEAVKVMIDSGVEKT